jgi:hypothetical protein
MEQRTGKSWGARVHEKNAYLTIGSAIAGFAVIVYAGMCQRNDPSQAGNAIRQDPPQATHVVKRGEFLRNIAPQYRNVGWESILLANEDFLKAKYVETCDPLPVRYTNNSRRRGLFCNDRYKRPYGNTLRPGWQLVIPAGQAPREVEEVIVDNTASGDDVAIVIDDSGSMAEDRRTVAQFYLAMLKKHGRNVEGVWLYVDGTVRKLDVPEDIEAEMTTAGKTENTFAAISEAAQSGPDKIILITDEAGDDWPGNLEQYNLPPVIATCLHSGLAYECEPTLKRLAEVTKGQYIAYGQNNKGEVKQVGSESH